MLVGDSQSPIEDAMYPLVGVFYTRACVYSNETFGIAVRNTR